MRASRLLAILILLQLRVRLTAEALAEEFEVSKRTIYRDIDALSAAGIPVYGDRGPGGGFQLLDGYRTKLTGLAADEAEALPVIGLPDAAAALGLGAPASRAQSKLLASMSPVSLEGAGRMSARFHLDPFDWYRGEEPVGHLPTLGRAVLDERAVQIRYESWKDVRGRLLHPLGLVMKGGAWYCVAATGAGNRIATFRVSNMRECRVLDETFERPADFDLASHWRASLDRFETELRPRHARLRASREGLRRLAELGAYAARAIAAVPNAVGWTELDLPVERDERAALVLLGIGDEIEVIAPLSLRQSLAAAAAAIALRNG